MLKNGIFCEMVILLVFKGFLLVKNLEILVQIVPDCSIYSYHTLWNFQDSVMVDGGFVISDELEELGVVLDIPCFLAGRD